MDSRSATISHLTAQAGLWAHCLSPAPLLCSSRRSGYGNCGSLHLAGESGHDGVLRIEPIIDPFLCLLKEALFSFGFRCESVDSSHNESPKHPAFGIFNSSSCAPVESGGTPLYSESDGVPAIPVHFFHTSFCLDGCLLQGRKVGFGEYPQPFTAVFACFLTRRSRRS